MKRLEASWEGFLHVLFICASVLVFVLMALICADVLSRSITIFPGTKGIAWANEVSEALLYVITMLSAPWLLSQGKHIRVDVILRVLPPATAWRCEWVADILALACSAVMTFYSAKATMASHASGAVTIKTLVTPEYWLLLPLPITFFLLGIEIIFRIRRLHAGPRTVRDEAISAA